MPGGYCSPACAKKHDPVQKALAQGPDLMGPCARCRRPWGALHFINGKPVYYHVPVQGGCLGVDSWLTAQMIGRRG